MKMSRGLPAVLFPALALVACAQTPGGPPATAPVATDRVTLADGGEFVELERTAEHSIVQVRSAPKGSVPSSLYTLRGVCAVLHARHAEYVSSEPVTGNAFPTYRLSFPATVPPEQASGKDRRVISSQECGLLGR